MRRIIALLLFTALSVAIGLFILLQPSDTISSENVALAELITELSAARNAGANHFEATRTMAGIEIAEHAELPMNQGSNRYFLVARGGALIATDFKHRVLVVITPVMEDGTLNWQCKAIPVSVAPKSCRQ